MGSKGKISKKSMAQAENFSSIYHQHVVCRVLTIVSTKTVMLKQTRHNKQ